MAKKPKSVLVQTHRRSQGPLPPRDGKGRWRKRGKSSSSPSQPRLFKR